MPLPQRNMNIDSDSPFPAHGRLAGVDFGSVRIGVAISDPQRILASPLQVVAHGSPQEMSPVFCELAREQAIVAWVVGLPIHLDGRESPKSRQVRVFARWLRDATHLPVRLFDERFSTAAAHQRFEGVKLTHQGRKKRIDAVAASVVLEAFIEAASNSDQWPGMDVDDKASGGDSIG